MKTTLWTNRLFAGAAAFCMISSSQGGPTPVWSFTPQTATTISILPTDVATIRYTIRNNSKKTHTLVMTPIQGITQITTGGNCPNPFVLAYLQECTLNLQVTGSAINSSIVGGPVVCEQGNPLECYRPGQANNLNITVSSAPPGTAFLTSSVQTLALSVNCPVGSVDPDCTSTNAALTGTPRTITITNTGSITATNVVVNPSTSLPNGASFNPNNCGNIVPGGTCVITVTPGGAPTALPGAAPNPIILNIEGTNTNTVLPSFEILTYGNTYQGGYVFAVDDTTPTTGSISGKVVTPEDQTPNSISSFYWAVDNIGDAAFDPIQGINETSVASANSCNGNSAGNCNSNKIFTFYSPGSNPNLYPAGICTATIGGYSDWYSPAICEMGYGTDPLLNPPSTCGDIATPLLQNMQSNLVDNNAINTLIGQHWSSTERSDAESQQAWYQDFQTGGAADQSFLNKGIDLAVRCVRVLTY